MPQREVADGDRDATAAELAALRAHLLRFAVTLPAVAIGDSRLDADAAGLFVRLPLDGGAGVEMREFATVRNRPRWSVSVLLPVGAAAEFQRLGWGRSRPADESGPLLLELMRPRHQADISPLRRVIATAHRVAGGAQEPNRHPTPRTVRSFR
ncbi:hypothetical protein OM076_20160 [Solirubrobacter ginsenosidimutans]|uniref:Uncharacterized protein n=1 Tax=Solirubrobacter ginsenosidimutans TaxID=490573 RepID=A0A9X3S1N7_9ACTN|nr:hypothetical protein [Solirubrobacter ginsenosidimutans]MDA0162599.1 hypothetical protein [Solirubrobacter ginsenosidimutans]